MIQMSEGVLLSALRLQLEGLAVLFGGVPHDTTLAHLAQREEEIEAGFDNLPL
jgi:hypothetical protein